MSTAPATTATGAVEIALGALETYAHPWDGARNSCGHDAGPLVLAAVLDSVGALPPETAGLVAQRWLDEAPSTVHAVGAFGGLGGLLTAVRAGQRLHPAFERLGDTLLGQVPVWLSGIRWSTSRVAWRDYDLFHGPAGLVLGGAAPGVPTRPLAPAARHLALLCDSPGLDRLRAGEDVDPRSSFNVGRINTGLGHGVTGVTAALRHATETFDTGDDYGPALRRACAWLLEEAFLADGGLITWPAVGRDGGPARGPGDRRQAWCYGTPGVSWTLWDAGRTLGDPELQDLGLAAMRSFCLVFDPDRHLDVEDPVAELTICHGAAGTLAVADAFARHVGLREAAGLRERLVRHLLDRTDRLTALARRDMTMLSGAGGVASALVTAAGGDRGWLPLLALR